MNETKERKPRGPNKPKAPAGPVVFDPNNIKAYVKDPRVATVYVDKMEGAMANFTIQTLIKYVNLGYHAEDEGFRWKLTISNAEAKKIAKSFEDQALSQAKGLNLSSDARGVVRDHLTEEERQSGANHVIVERLAPVNPSRFLEGDQTGPGHPEF